MRRDRYRSVPTQWLRILLAATDNAFGHHLLRGHRLAMDAELTARVIQEESESSGSWPALPVEGDN